MTRLHTLIITALMLCCLTSFASTNHSHTQRIEDDILSSAVEPSISIPELDSLLNEADEDDEEFDLTFSDSTSTSTWDHTRVNPFNIKLKDIKDTTLNLRGYVHPNHNITTSEYGPRWGRFHAGIDMRVKVGDTIRVAFDGKVRIARSNKNFRKKGYGYFVMVRHPNGLETLYAHLSKVLVATDSIVTAGTAIGLGGNTGRSTGPHLHYEFRYLGNPISPRTVVDFETGKLISEDYLVNQKTSFKELDSYLNNPGVYHRVRQGDTLGKIARKYHTSVNKICKLNKIKPTTVLRIGRKLRVH